VARAVPGTGGGGVVALRDANKDGRFEVKEALPGDSTTGIAIHNGYLYLAHPTTIERIKLTAGQLKPTGMPETIVTGLPSDRQHEDKGIAFDGKGSLYINVGRAIERLPDQGSTTGRDGDRIPVPFSRSTAASGSSTRTSSIRSRRTGRASPPAFVRCRRSRGTTTRSSSR
jgi:glucose/arabinose dehydrogenase